MLKGSHQKTCRRGHEMTPESTWTSPTSGRIMCKTCANIRASHRQSDGYRPAIDEICAMSFEEIGARLGVSAWCAERACASALRKLRAVDLTLFKEAVWLKRRAIDARPGNGAWNDIDAED